MQIFQKAYKVIKTLFAVYVCKFILMVCVCVLTVIWSHSCTGCIPCLREISESHLWEMNGYLLTWNCWERWLCLEFACHSNCTRWDACETNCHLFSVSNIKCDLYYFIHLEYILIKVISLNRITSPPLMSMRNHRCCLRRFLHTSRRWWSLMRVTRPGAVLFCPIHPLCSPSDMFWTKAPTNTRSSCLTDVTSVSGSSRWGQKDRIK